LSAIAGFVGFLGLAVFASWLAFSLGRWLGTREARRDDREHDAPVGSVVAATLGLLAFTLAMAFNMAHTKHSGRKALVREDVKAIQMAYDRAMLLPPEASKSAHEQLAEYARIRAFDTFSQADVPLELIIRRSEEIQHELWLQAVAHREHTNVRFYMDALSKHDHVPLFVWISLAFVTALGMVTMGYQASLAGSRRTMAMIPLIVAFGVVFCLGARPRPPSTGDPPRGPKPDATPRGHPTKRVVAQTATSANAGSLANRATWCSWSPKRALSAYMRLK
jgi:hypothetical protein